MSKALSLDLRVRVLAAVAEGASHREAAARFGVSAASVSRWRALTRRRGDARPGPLGGDRRTGRVEAQAGTILGLVEAAPDITIEELRGALAGRGLGFGYGTLQRFLIRHGLTRKKRLAMRASRTGPTS
jgi:transposase